MSMALNTSSGPAFPRHVKIAGEGKRLVDEGRGRLVLIAMVFAAAFSVLAVRLIYLTLFPAGGEPSIARSVIKSGAGVASTARAAIRDRNGVLLAVSLPTASLFAKPYMVRDAEGLADRILRILPRLDRDRLVRKLSSGRRFVWIRRSLTPEQHQALNALGEPALDFKIEERRIYPQGRLAAHLVGYTDVDGRGIAGIEAQFNDALAKPGDAGRDIVLSLDARIQHALRDELSRAMAIFRAKGAAGVVLDVRSGEFLALVSLPDFDPNRAGDFSADARFNRATLGVFELGSVFKAFTAAMALDYGVVGVNGGYDATRPLKISRFSIRDEHGKGRWLSVPEIVIYSSNIGAAKMALDVGGDRQRQFLDRFGLTKKLKVELPEIGRPLLPRRWGLTETATIAFGHGISVSPAQLAVAFARVVNGGFDLKPTLLRRKADADARGERLISARAADLMRRILRKVVTNGTAGFADAPGYRVGGKTGTADKAGRGGYNREAIISTFAGAFPMDDPRYVVLAMLDEPRGIPETNNLAQAGWTAAPVVGRVITRIAPLLGVAPKPADDPGVFRALKLKVKTKEKKLETF